MNIKIILTATLLILAVVLKVSSDLILNTDDLIYDSFSNKFTQNQLNDLIELKNKWKFWGYFSIPFILLFKITIISATIDAGLFFFNEKVKFTKIWNIVVKAEYIFLLVIVVKTIWFLILDSNYDIYDLETFYPFSAINIIGHRNIDSWFIYPLQLLNLFELAYWIVLGYLLNKEISHKNNDQGLKIIAYSYGLSLFLWTGMIMFFYLNIN